MINKQLSVAVACALCVTVNQHAYSANDIEIVSGSVQTNVTGSPSFTTTNDSAQLGVDDITTIWNTAVSDTVSITTTELGANSQLGDVTFSGDLGLPLNNQFLIINAHNDIIINGSIAGYSALDGFKKIDVTLNPDSDALNGGDVFLNGTMSGSLNTTINGTLTIGATGSYSLDHWFSSLTVESIDVVAGGSFNFANGIDFGGDLTLTNSGITIGVGGLLGNDFTLDDPSLTLANDNVLTIDSGASFTIDLGHLEVGSISNSGTFNFDRGELILTNSGLTVGTGELLGNNVSLSRKGLELSNNNVLTINSGASLTTDNGHLIVGSITNNGNFNFNSGFLSLTNSGLTIGSGGLLGANVTLSNTRDLNVSGDVTVDSGATLLVVGNDAGDNHFFSNLNNQGTVTIDETVNLNDTDQGILTVDGAITNDGAGASLTVAGGILNAGSINNINDGSFTFTSGHLGLTNSGLTVGSGGLLGDNVALTDTRSLTVAGDVTVDSGATLSTGGVSTSQNHFLSNLNNQGTVTIDRSLTIDGAVTNDGVGSSMTVNASLTAASMTNVNGASLGLASGSIDLAGGALTNDGAGSTTTIDGGTLKAGSISNTNNGSFIFNAGNLELTNSTFTVGSSGLFGDNVALSGTRTLDVSGDVTVDSGAVLSMASGGHHFSSNLNNNGTTSTNGRLTVGGNLNNTGVVTVSSGNGELVVGGILTNDGAGASLTVDGGSLTAASISNINNGSFVFNSGSLELTDSGVTIGTGGLLGDTVISSGQSLGLTSSNPANNVLTIDATGSLTLDGGNLTVGSVSNSGDFFFNSGRLALTDSDLTIGAGELLGNTLTLSTNMELSIKKGNALVIDSGATFTLDGGSLVANTINNSGTFNFNSGELFSDSDVTFGGSSTITLTSGNEIDLNYNNFFGAGKILTLEGSASIDLDGGWLTVGNIVNNGTGSVNFNSGYFRVTGSDFTVGSGGILGDTVTIGADSHLLLWPDYSLIVDSGASFTLDGGRLATGSVINNGGAFIFNSGELNFTNAGAYDMTVGSAGLLGDNVTLNAGHILDLGQGDLIVDADADFTMNGAKLTASSIVNNGNFIFNSGSLHLSTSNDPLTVGVGGLLGDGNVALSATRQMTTNSIVNVDSGATLSVVGGLSSFSGGGGSNSGLVKVTGGELHLGSFANSSSVRVADGGLLATGGYTQSAGHTDINAGGAMSSGDYAQNGGRTTVNGTLTASTVVINAGVLGGSGVIDGSLLVSGATLSPGNSPGALEVTGDLIMTEGSTLLLEAVSDGGTGYFWDQLIVGGAYDLQGGLVKFNLLDGMTIADLEADFTMDDFFRSGTTGSNVGFLDLVQFGNLDLFAYDVVGDSWFSLALDGSGAFTGTPSVAPVPLPAAFWLFGSGLLGLIGVARRRAA